MSAPAVNRSRWGLLVELFARPYPTSVAVLVPFLAYVVLVLGYLVIGASVRVRTLHLPALALDRAWPVQPGWTLVYGSLYFAIFLPLIVVRQQEHIRRTLWAFVLMFLVGSLCWLIYPTILPRPALAALGEGFCAWSLRIAYRWDAPYNCFPSLHVAQAFFAAFTCYRVSRGIGLAAVVWASLIALSTLFTKQHYVVDVITGILLAGVAYLVFVRNCPRDGVLKLDERLAPVIVLGFVGIHLLTIAGFWVAYVVGWGP